MLTIANDEYDARLGAKLSAAHQHRRRQLFGDLIGPLTVHGRGKNHNRVDAAHLGIRREWANRVARPDRTALARRVAIR